MKRLKDCRQAFAKFWRAVKGLKSNLKALLFQLPPSFKYNEVNMKRLKKLTYLPATNNTGVKINIVFEFRDDSWFKKDVVRLFKSRGWVLGGTLIKKKKGQYWMGNMPAGLHLPEKPPIVHICEYMADAGIEAAMIANNYKILSGPFLQNILLLTMLSLTMSFLIVAKKLANIKKEKFGMLLYAMLASLVS